MTFLRSATRWHRAHLVCVVSPHSHAIIFFHSLSLTHIYFTCYTPCASFYGQRDVVAVPSPTLPSPLFLYTFSAPCFALFNTLWQHLSSLLFGIVDPAQKTKHRKKMKSGRKNQQIFRSTFGFAFHFSHFVSFRCVLFVVCTLQQFLWSH